MLTLDPNEELKLYEQDSIILNSSLTTPKTIREIATKGIVDSQHECNRNRRDMSTVFNDQDIEFDNIKLTNLDSFTLERNPTIANDLSNKKNIDDK